MEYGMHVLYMVHVSNRQKWIFSWMMKRWSEKCLNVGWNWNTNNKWFMHINLSSSLEILKTISVIRNTEHCVCVRTWWWWWWCWNFYSFLRKGNRNTFNQYARLWCIYRKLEATIYPYVIPSYILHKNNNVQSVQVFTWFIVLFYLTSLDSYVHNSLFRLVFGSMSREKKRCCFGWVGSYTLCM